MVLILVALVAQSFQLNAPAEVSTGDLVSLRLTRDGAPLAGATLRVTAPAAEIATVTASQLVLRDGRTALFKGDAVLVTGVNGADCGVVVSSGATGVAPCEGLERRAFGQPLGTTDSDGRVLSRDLAAVAASVEIAAVAAGDTLAMATVRVRPFVFDETSPVAPGIAARSRRWMAGDQGPFVMHTVEVESRPETFLLPVRAKDRALGVEGLTNLSRRHGALVALNGAAFAADGSPYAGAALGPYVWNNRALAAGESGAALFLCATSRAAVGPAAVRVRVVAGDGQTLDVAGLNRRRGDDEAVLYTPLAGDRTLTGEGGFEVVLDPQDRVRETRDGGGEIPFDGRVLSATGAAAEWLRSRAAPGALLRVELTVAAGPCAATDVVPSMVVEPDERRPRSAFALTDRGSWLLAVADGNQASTPGMRQDEFERELAALGATAFVHLAGGGAASLTVADGLRSSPSTGEASVVGDALLVFQVGDLSGWIKVLDRVASEPGQVSPVAIETLNPPLAAAVDAYLEGDAGALRMAVLQVRDLIRKLDGVDISVAGARVMVRATEAFLTTLPDIQPLRKGTR